ncbi:MAG: response regulator [Eubacteriales bacterium]|nr:response regulator [Eubacteriales bacterium]
MYRYIIVDDESLIRRGTRKKLESMQDMLTCVGEASDGQEAIRLAEELKPDLAIVDMQMPNMSGMELLPILHQKHPDIKLIVISGFRDFDYIKQAIASGAVDYILKPFSKEAIQKCVKTALSAIEDQETITRQITSTTEEKESAYYEYDIQYLTNLILGYHTGSSRISSKKLNFINDTHHLVLMTLYFGKKRPDMDMQGWVEEQGFGDLALYLSDKSVPELGFLILFMPTRNAINTQNLVLQISDALLILGRAHQVSLQIGISPSHEDLTELHQAFRETSSALNDQLLDNSLPSVYTYEKETPPRTLVWDREDEFLFRLEAGMNEEVRKLTAELFLFMKKQKNFTLNDAKYYCYTLTAECQRIMNYYLKQENPGTSGSMQNIVSHIFHLEELEEYYLQFFLNMTDLLKPQSVYALDDVVEKMQLYMQFNYQKDLTQDYIASLFYMNRSYLSTIFKQRTGMKFVDYLNNIRIEKAMEYLQTSDRKMYQIAKSVGYDNTKYFFRVFKKKTGMTPEQYREKFR